MAEELRIVLAALLRKARMGHYADFLKEGVRALSWAIRDGGRGAYKRRATSGSSREGTPSGRYLR